VRGNSEFRMQNSECRMGKVVSEAVQCAAHGQLAAKKSECPPFFSLGTLLLAVLARYGITGLESEKLKAPAAESVTRT
jgi:hypothetical protein